MFMATPMDAYFAQTRRTDLADSADAIVRAFEQDIPTALPNSLRINRTGSVVAVEILATAGSARYWISGEAGPGTPADLARELDFPVLPTPADLQFATDGAFGQAVHNLLPNSYYLSVNNEGTAGKDAYELQKVITPKGVLIGPTTAGAEDPVTLPAAFRFTNGSSPTHTAFVVTGPVAYLCDEAAHTVTRYWNYSIAADPTTRDTAPGLIGAGAQHALVAQFPTVCQFTSTAETASRGALLSLAVTLVKDGETVQLFHQIAVEKIR